MIVRMAFEQLKKKKSEIIRRKSKQKEKTTTILKIQLLQYGVCNATNAASRKWYQLQHLHWASI